MGFNVFDARGPSRVGGQDCGWRVFVAAHHFLPQAHAFAWVEASACSHDQAQGIGFTFIVAAKFQGQQIGPHLRGHVAQVAQAQQRSAQPQATIRDHLLAHLFTRVLQECVRGFVAHHHGDFVVVKLQLGQDAVIKSDLAAGHAKGVDLAAADEVDFPLPSPRALVALGGERDHALGDVTQALHLCVFWWHQRTLAGCLLQHLFVLLHGAALHLVSRHGLGEGGAFALRDAGLRGQCAGQTAGQQGLGEQAASGSQA